MGLFPKSIFYDHDWTFTHVPRLTSDSISSRNYRSFYSLSSTVPVNSLIPHEVVTHEESLLGKPTDGFYSLN